MWEDTDGGFTREDVDVSVMGSPEDSFQPQDLECILQGFGVMRNFCSLSGRWWSKSLTQDEYIDKLSSDTFSGGFGVAFSD